MTIVAWLVQQIKASMFVLLAMAMFIGAGAAWVRDRQLAIHRECKAQIESSFAELSREKSAYTQADGEVRIQALERAQADGEVRIQALELAVKELQANPNSEPKP